jgi:hypothetical protein
MELIDDRYAVQSYPGGGGNAAGGNAAGDEVPLATIPGCTVDFRKVFI